MNWKAVLAFVAGAAIGGGLGFVVGKKLTEAKCDQEIEELREYYANPDKKTLADIMDGDTDNEEKEEAEKKEDKPDLAKMAARVRYDAVLKKEGYVIPEEDEEEPVKDIEIISAEDFIHTDNDRHSMTYYTGDNTLVDDDDGEIIEDIQSTISHEALNHFLDGVLYVRNNKTEIDYEISEDPRRYEDIASELY